jgi:hypothetical protein
MKKCILLVVLSVIPVSVYSDPAWYFGEITRVWHYNDDGFIVTLNSSSLSDCKHNYAYFKKSEIGSDQKQALYSMALSALHTGIKVGIVIDKQGEDTYCLAKSMDIRR